MRVSFIVPVYKVEKYLRDCVGSLLDQTFRDLEIILVDDGSPDRCPVICDELAVEDSRIKVVHKKNGGLSSARNAGLEVATGDYVAFIDSDDFWRNEKCLENIMDVVCAHPECDFVNFNCSYFYSESGNYKDWRMFDEGLGHPVDRDLAMNMLVSSGTVPMSACLKMISRKVLVDMDLKFDEGLHCEDIPWFINLMDKTGRCMFVNHYVYAYRQNVSGSITATFGEKSFNDLLYIVSREVDKLPTRSFSEQAKKALLSFLGYEFCILLASVKNLPSNVQKDARKRLLEYRWLLEYTVNPKVKAVNFINRILGIGITEILLRAYLKNH